MIVFFLSIFSAAGNPYYPDNTIVVISERSHFLLAEPEPLESELFELETEPLEPELLELPEHKWPEPHHKKARLQQNIAAPAVF
jgi:hypothetical protein